MRSRVLLLLLVVPLALPLTSFAGDGLVALQTADPSCPDDSGDIYVDCGNGTVTDNRTGLVWLQNANCLGPAGLRDGLADWYAAMDFVAGLADMPPPPSVTAADDCGLSDGSSPGDWRLPSAAEWEVMIADALGQGEGDPNCKTSPPTITNDSGGGCWVSGPRSFSGVESFFYWASTTRIPIDNDDAWAVALDAGTVGSGGDKIAESGLCCHVWSVRGGQ